MNKTKGIKIWSKKTFKSTSKRPTELEIMLLVNRFNKIIHGQF